MHIRWFHSHNRLLSLLQRVPFLLNHNLYRLICLFIQMRRTRKNYEILILCNIFTCKCVFSCFYIPAGRRGFILYWCRGEWQGQVPILSLNQHHMTNLSHRTACAISTWPTQTAFLRWIPSKPFLFMTVCTVKFNFLYTKVFLKASKSSQLVIIYK